MQKSIRVDCLISIRSKNYCDINCQYYEDKWSKCRLFGESLLIETVQLKNQ